MPDRVIPLKSFAHFYKKIVVKKEKGKTKQNKNKQKNNNKDKQKNNNKDKQKNHNKDILNLIKSSRECAILNILSPSLKH